MSLSAAEPDLDHRRWPAARVARPDLGRRGQSVRSPRRRPTPRHAHRTAQGRARTRRSRGRVAGSHRAAANLAEWPLAHLGPCDPPRGPRRRVAISRRRARPPAGGDGAHPRRRGSGPSALPETALFLPRLPYLTLGVPGSAELAERIAAALSEPPEPLPGAVLLERHGAVAVGTNLARPSIGSSSSRSFAERGATRC